MPTTCRHCPASLTFRGIAYVDSNGSRIGHDGHRHTPAPMAAADIIDMVCGPDDNSPAHINRRGH